MTSPTPAEIDTIRELYNCCVEWLVKKMGTHDVGTLLAAIRDRDGTIERLTREAAIRDAQAGARHADVAALEAEVARLTAERDEAAAKERERCAKLVRCIGDEFTYRAREAADERGRDECYACSDAFESAADAIARGEPQGDSDA